MKLKRMMKAAAATGLAVVMSLGMSTAAFAATLDNVTTVKNGGEIGINKSFTMAKDGMTKPDSTFTFTVTPGNSSPAIANSTVTMNASDIDLKDGTGTAESVTKIFADSDFASADPGIYKYTITESAISFTNDESHILYKDPSTWNIEVKVVSDNGTNKIAGITAKKGDDGTKADKITFDNTYTELANNEPTDPDNPAGDTDNGLVITKKVTGESAKTSDEFEYSIKFTAPAGNKDADGNAIPVTIKSDTNDTKVVGNTVSYGTAYTFKLKKDQKIAFSLPAGTHYTVTESDKVGYTAASEVVTNGTKSTTGDESVTSYVGEKQNTVTYTNTAADVGALTGIINQYGPLMAVAAIAIAGMAALIVMRRRRNDSEYME